MRGTRDEFFHEKKECSQKLKKFMLLDSAFRADFEYHITLSQSIKFSNENFRTNNEK